MGKAMRNGVFHLSEFWRGCWTRGSIESPSKLKYSDHPVEMNGNWEIIGD